MSIVYNMGEVSSRLQRNTVNRSTTNKRDVMRAICRDYGNYIDEPTLEQQFDECVDFYELVGVSEMQSHCICGHDVWYNYIVAKKSDKTTKEFVIGNDCIRLFGQGLIEYTHSLKVIQEGKRVPTYFSALFNNPTEVISAIQEHITYKVGDYDEFRLVKAVKGKYKGLYRILGLKYNKSSTTDLKLQKTLANRVKVHYINSDKVVGRFNKDELYKQTEAVGGLYDVPIASCDINRYNDLMHREGIPEMNDLEVDFGKYEGMHLPEIVVRDKGYAEWLLSKGVGSHEITTYLEEAQNG